MAKPLRKQMSLSDYPEAIADLRHRMLQLDEDLIQLQETQNILGLEIEKSILADTTLTNEAKRSAARKQMQQSDIEYAGVTVRIKDTRIKRGVMEIQLDQLKQQFAVLQLLTQKQIAEMSTISRVA